MKGSCHRRELSRACCRVGHLAVTRYKTSCRRLHAFGALIFSSCSKDDDAENDNSGPVINPDKNIPDPKGTITMNMMVGDDEGKRVSIKDFGTIQISSAYNFKGYEYNCSFVSLGKMKGLGNVTAIPQDGWNSSVAVILVMDMW